MDLTRNIANNHKRLYQVNQIASKPETEVNNMSEFCNNNDNLDRNNVEQFGNVVCNVLNVINITNDRKSFKGRLKFLL